MRRRPSMYTREQRIQIIKEYETGTMTLKELAQKYGLGSNNLILVWRKRLLESGKNTNFAPDDEKHLSPEESMKEKSKEELQGELAVLKKQLEWATLQNKALNTLIDIAEEQGIRIRKKSGAKQ